MLLCGTKEKSALFVKQTLLQCYIVKGQTKRKQIYVTDAHPVSRGEMVNKGLKSKKNRGVKRKVDRGGKRMVNREQKMHWTER